jgi:short-subunit dehydrogenase
MIGAKDKYVLVTGASSGLGYELTKLFAKDGKNIVVVARSMDKLEYLRKELEDKNKTKVKVLAKDLSKPEVPQEILSELEKEHIEVDVLVNNAGLGVYGMFSETNLQQELEMIQVNISSLTSLTKLFLKKMLENKSGKILNISSGAGFVPMTQFSVYGGTKSYVVSFSEALANELRGTGVTVTCFAPPNMKTLFWERSNAEDCKVYRRGLLFMDASTVARLAYKSLAKGKGTAFAGLRLSLAMFSTRFMPRNLVTKILGSMMEPA